MPGALLKHELDREARCLKLLGYPMPEQLRYNERTTAERANARLNDEFGARHIWVRGADKIMCHLMFGVLALCVDQLMRFVA